MPYIDLGGGLALAHWDGLKEFALWISRDYVSSGTWNCVLSDDGRLHGTWRTFESDPRFQFALEPGGALSALRETPLDVGRPREL